MKPKEIREKSVTEIENLKRKLREELAMLRIQACSGQLAEVTKIRAVRRDIARILTIERAKASKGGSPSGASGQAKK